MALKRFKGDPGQVVVLEHDSKILQGQPARRPARAQARRVAAAAIRRHRASGASRCSTTWSASPARASRTSPGRTSATTCPSAPRASSTSGKMGPAIIVFPDCFTALGGNQYVNSSAIGNYADYLTREIVPFVDREFRTLASREHRGCFGKSSGGYGSIIHGMKYPKHLGRDRRPLRRRLLRLRLLARLAEHPERARQVPRAASASPAPTTRSSESRRKGLARRARTTAASRRFLDSGVEEAQAQRRPKATHHEPVHGRDLRSRSPRAQRLPRAVQPRDRRGDPRALAPAGASTTRSTW